MNKIEVTCLEVEDIINLVFIDLTMQMISLEMDQQQAYMPMNEPKNCFEIRTEGAFVSLILFEMEESVFEAIAAKIFPKEEISDQEKKLYVIEYLNVICGRVLSKINNFLGKRSKLSVPIIIDNNHVSENTGKIVKLSYLCSEGAINIVINYDIQG